MHKVEKKIYQTSKFWIFSIGTLLLIYGLTILLMYRFNFNFPTTGTIGDTFGVTAPFINLIGAIFVYLAFREQLNANQQLQTQINEQKDAEKTEKQDEILRRHITIIKNEIEQLEYTSNFGVKFNGLESIPHAIVSIQDWGHNENTIMNDRYILNFMDILSMFDSVHKHLLSGKISTDEATFSGVVIYRIALKFFRISNEAFKEYIHSGYECDICQHKHELPKRLISNFEKVKESYRELLKEPT